MEKKVLDQLLSAGQIHALWEKYQHHFDGVEGILYFQARTRHYPHAYVDRDDGNKVKYYWERWQLQRPPKPELNLSYNDQITDEHWIVQHHLPEELKSLLHSKHKQLWIFASYPRHIGPRHEVHTSDYLSTTEMDLSIPIGPPSESPYFLWVVLLILVTIILYRLV